MIKAIIVDDEPHCIDRIADFLRQEFSDSIVVSAIAMSVPAALESIVSLQPDLVFLDVEIHELTGFDLLTRIGNINFDVIFVTAHEKYAMQAIKFSAADYLLKPVDIDEFRKTVGNYLSRKQIAAEKKTNYELLLAAYANLPSKNKRIAIPTQNEILFVDIENIIRCQSDVNYTTLFFNNQKSVFVARTLKDFENLLSGANFFRVHNSHLINLDYVRSYHRSGFVLLSDNTKIEVSTRRKDDFLNAIGSKR